MKEIKFPTIKAIPQKSLQYYKERNVFDGSEKSSETSIFFSAHISGLGKQLVGVARKGKWSILLIPFIETEDGKIEQVNIKYGGGAVLETTLPKETSRKLVSRTRKKNVVFEEKENKNFSYIITGLYPVMVVRVIESRIEFQ